MEGDVEAIDPAEQVRAIEHELRQVRSGAAREAALAGAQQGRPAARGRARRPRPRRSSPNWAGRSRWYMVSALGREGTWPIMLTRWRSSIASARSAEAAQARCMLRSVRGCSRMPERRRVSVLRCRGGRASKKPGRGRVFRSRRGAAPQSDQAALQRLDAGVQAALVAGSLVLVDQATRAEAIEDRLRDCEGGLGAGGVVGVEGLEHLLDGGAQHRTLAGVAGVADDGLLGALLGGLDVGHGGNSWKTLVRDGNGDCGTSKTRKYGGFRGLRQQHGDTGAA